MSEQKEDSSAWVFDSLICFLNGPVWNAPLQSFIDEKSLIFDPDVLDNEEYSKIFDEFKNLVDFMLSNFMDDLGITPEQFQKACNEGKKYHVSFDHSLFEQIWAANDYHMFVRLMIQKNVELQLQALELIENKYGIKPQSYVPKSRHEPNISLPEDASTNTNNVLEVEVLNEVAKNFADENNPSVSTELIEDVIEHKPILEEQLKKAQDEVRNVETNKSNEPSNSEISFQKPNKEIDAMELKKRQEYLRAQRDKLVALKKEARKKQLDASSSPQKNRPKSAEAAKAVLATGETPNVQPNVLQIRKSLAEKLKMEVVDKN